MFQRLLQAASAVLPSSPLRITSAGEEAATSASESEAIPTSTRRSAAQRDALLDDLTSAHAFTRHGIHVFPDTCNALIWHGVGVPQPPSPFTTGVFRFILCIPISYPSDGAIPLLLWLEVPWHPAIDAESGLMNLTPALPSRRWSREDRLTTVLEAVRDVLYAPAITHCSSGRGASTRGRVVHYNVEAADECVSRPLVYTASAHNSAVASRASARGVTSSGAWDAPSPYTPTVAAFMACPDIPLTRAQLTIARAVADIGYARGFRFPSPDALQQRVLSSITRTHAAKCSDRGMADAIVKTCALYGLQSHVVACPGVGVGGGGRETAATPPRRRVSDEGMDEATRRAEAAIAALDDDLQAFQTMLDA